jgi:hypothetical protein
MTTSATFCWSLTRRLGAVYAASQNAAAANKIADVPDAFGVAYNNGLGKMMMVTPKPVGEITCPSETSSCAGKLAECIPMALDQCPCYAKYSVCLDSVNVGICQMSALSVANAASAKKVCVSTCTEARCIALMQGSTATGTAMATTVTGSLDSAATTVTGSLAATLLVTIVTLAQ